MFTLANRLLPAVGGGGADYEFIGVQDHNGNNATFSLGIIPPGDVFLFGGMGSSFGVISMRLGNSQGDSLTIINPINTTVQGTNVTAVCGVVQGWAGGNLNIYMQGVTRIQLGSVWLKPGLVSSWLPIDNGKSGGGPGNRSTGNLSGAASVMLAGSYSGGLVPAFTDADDFINGVGSSQALAIGIVLEPTDPDVMTSTNSRALSGIKVA